MKQFPASRFTYSLIFFIVIFAGCSPSVTNVWEYYVKNTLEHHEAGTSSSCKAKMLYRQQEEINKAQLELVAYKNDKMKCMVVGSHKIAKSFYLGDSLYYFDVNDLYSNVRGNDFIRQMGDLSIFFTNIPQDKCEAFLLNVDKLKSEFMKAGVTPEVSSYFDYSITNDVFVSIQKKFAAEQLDNATTVLWVGKRKHEVKLEALVKAFQDLKSFN